MESMIEANDYVVAFFVKEQCKYCEILEKEMNKVAEMEKMDVPILRLDMTQLSTSTKKWDVQGFPTLKLFIKQMDIEYIGEWNSDQISDWITERVGTMFMGEVQEEQFIETFSQNVEISIMYFYQKPLQFMEEYDKLARIHKGDRVLFSYTRLENARKLMDVDEDVEFALWNDFGRNKFEFRGEKNISQLNGFIQDNMNPQILNFYQFQDQLFYKKDKAQLFIITFDKNISQFNEIGQYFKNEQPAKLLNILYSLRLIHVAQNDTDPQYNRLINYLGVINIRLPLLVIVANNKKYRIQTQLNQDTIKKFGIDFLKGSLKPFYKSQQQPYDQDWKKTIIDVVGQTYQKQVLDNNNDVLLYLYSTWCKPCQDFESTFIELFKIYKEKIVLAKMDITQNDIENDHIEYVPSLRLYKQKKMTEYKGELDLEDIKQFLKNQKNKSDL